MKATLLGAAWLTGVCLAYFESDSIPLAIFTAALAGMVVFLRHDAAWAAAAAILLIGGFTRYASSDDSISPSLEPASSELTAVVEDDARNTGNTRSFPARIRDSSAQEWEGELVLFSVPAFLEVEYGDLFSASGLVEPLDPNEVFNRHLIESGVSGRLSYPEQFRVLQGGYGTWWREPLVEIRSWASGRIDSVLPEPASGLARGMLLGERADIDNELRSQLSDAGISHLIAISGQNVVLLAGLVTALVAPLAGRRFAALAALAAISGYAAFLGAPPAILRATLMGALFVLAPLFGRQSGGLGTLMLAGLLLTAIEPRIVGDLSFQLSFAAVGGLMLLTVPIADSLKALLASKKLPELPVIREALAVTASAWLATLPVIAINFDQVSVAGLGANSLVSFAFTPMLVSTLVAIPASFLPWILQILLTWPAWVLFEYFRSVGELAAPRQTVINVSGFTSLHATLVYIGLAAAAVLLGRARPTDQVEKPLVVRPGPVVFVPALVVLNLLTWPALFHGGDDEMRVTFLDVGQGDAILIETPHDHRILVDGGPDPARLIRELDEQLGFGSRGIDLLLLTHMDSDHATGTIAVLERYDVKRVGWNGFDDRSPLGQMWLDAVTGSGAELIRLAAGDQLLVDGLQLSVLWPDSGAPQEAENEGSLVIRLSYHETDVLLTGDIGFESEVALLARQVHLEAEVLKVAHHGSGGSSLPEFIAAVDPDFAVIQSGISNSFGHPHPMVLERLTLARAAVVRNDLGGSTTFVTDGASIWRD
jgi:competence protein ComEC